MRTHRRKPAISDDGNILANAEFLERHDICASVRADLLLEIQEAVLAMTERIESLLQFGSSGERTAAVKDARYNLDNCRIYAPFDAIVTNLTIAEGR